MRDVAKRRLRTSVWGKSGAGGDEAVVGSLCEVSLQPVETGGAVGSEAWDQLGWGDGSKEVVGDGEIDKSDQVGARVGLGGRDDRVDNAVSKGLAELLAGDEVSRANGDIEMVGGLWRESERGLGNSARGEQSRGGEESLVLHLGKFVGTL